MARSTCIYVIVDGETILGTFTVKHEMISALKKLSPENKKYADVMRFDNGSLDFGKVLGSANELLLNPTKRHRR